MINFRLHLAPMMVLATLVGCDSDGPSTAAMDSPHVQVLYQDGPLPDVCVRLHETQEGPVLAQAISQHDGRARFTELPSPAPDQYFVSMESVSDGGWLLDSKITQAKQNAIRLDSFTQSPQQTIQLPRGAVRSLTTNRKHSR
ncbi:hypothetical protein SAMN06265222_108190 [Neorhodopirellula lusitana]|uniref:Lipoprotein n=1 Tax=Neorhodopirellula lusitana TaxID=445327 RepID=A0ABY1QCX3_9BACT|nr:hypothetical protein [Neorhodopirellula lusitana]SMP64236.1 hypothetical protein SAMN06265222_108190 [Neorhodopirellula lusitana]